MAGCFEIAEGVAAQGPFGKDPMFVDLWQQAAEMLQSYSDEKYISDAYATDLSQARSVAVEMERISEDPPERVAAWVATVSDEQIRRLDQQVLGDLLVVETRRDDWRKVLALALGRLEQLVLVGDLPPAQELLDTLLRLSRDPSSEVAADAKAGVEQLAAGEVLTHLVLFIRQAEEAELPRATRFCLSLGKPVAGRLIDAMLAEENPRTIRRLREVLVSFGSAATSRIAELRSARNPAVRRAAIDLARLLDPARRAPPSGRAARRRRAAGAARRAARDHADGLGRGLCGAANRPDQRRRAHPRDDHALGRHAARRAGGAAFAYIVRQSDHRGDYEAFYRSALETLGHLGASSEPIVQALQGALTAVSGGRRSARVACAPPPPGPCGRSARPRP